MLSGQMNNPENVVFFLSIVYVISMLSRTRCLSTENTSKKPPNASKRVFNIEKYEPPDSNPIINGIVAGEREFPYIVALRVRGLPYSQYGSGSIVKKSWDTSQESEWIITARHNIIDIKSPLTNPSVFYWPLIVYPKYSNRDQDLPNFPHFNVKATYCHPWPRSQPRPIDDIALIELDRKIELNKPPYYFQNITMVDKHFDINSWQSMITIAGWGYNQTNPNMLPEYLMKANVRIIPSSYCETFYPGFKSLQKFCAGRNEPGFGPTTSCGGDSGGPAVIKGGGKELLAGVIVGGNAQCNRPSISMRVAYYRDWIDMVMVDRPRSLNCSDLLKNRPP